jgi:xyloglucan-specific exo-beta-1,4-glucanase
MLYLALVSKNAFIKISFKLMHIHKPNFSALNILKCVLHSLFIFFLIAHIFTESHAQYNWSNLPIGGGGFVSGIITSKSQPGLMYARTDVGGAYRWDSPNSKWIPLFDWVSENETGYMGVESMAIDEKQPNRLYILAGTSYFNGGKTAILISNDYGATFTIKDVSSQFKAHGNGMGRQTGEKLVVDPVNSNIIYCGTRLGGLWKSADAGLTWSQVWNGAPGTDISNANGISAVVLDSSSVSGGITQRIFFGVSRTNSTNLYVSNDGGATFAGVSGAITTLMPQRMVLSADSNLYVTYADTVGPWNITNTIGKISKYNIATSAWTPVSPAPNKSFGGISIDPKNPKRLVASTINVYDLQYGTAYGDRIYLSTDGGLTWKDLFNGGITLDNNGITWIGGNAIHWAGCVEFDPFDTKKVWVVSGNGIFTNDDVDSSPAAWRFEVKGLEETVALGFISIEGGPVVSVIGDYDGFRNTDVTKYGTVHQPRMGSTSGLDYASLNPKVVLRAGSAMYYSMDTAKTWTKCTMKGSNGQVAVSANGMVFLHAPENSSTVYRSVDAGATWVSVSGLNVTGMKPVADPVNSNKFYAYNSNTGAMMVSTDGGRSFVSGGVVGYGGRVRIGVTPGKEGHLWVARSGGLSRSVNSGSSFSVVSGVTYCEAVGLGKADSATAYHTIYIWGTVGGIQGLYKSTDQGTNWVRINDDTHEYGGTGNGAFVVGDMNEYGRVYMSTVGRGIVMGRRVGADTNQAPVVSISSPANGSTFVAGDTIAITVTASDPDGSVSYVEFYDGSVLIGTSSTYPYSFQWNNVPVGTHTIIAHVTDNMGLLSVSASAMISDTVTPDCHGDHGGSAYVDSCSTCVGGKTGLSACLIDCYGDWGGTAYVDNCSQCVGGNTGLSPCVIMQGEAACTYNGNIYTYGTTFLSMQNSVGASATWAFQSAGSQSITLKIIYFNNGSTAYTAQLFVNNVSQIASVSFPPAGFSWVEKDITFSLSDGTNQVKLVLSSTSNGYGFAIDNFTWNNSAVTPGNCSALTAVNAATAGNESNLYVYPNPFTEEVSVTFNAPSVRDMNLKVIDMKGRVVYESGAYRTNQKINLGKELPAASGIYMIIGIYDDKMQVVKVEKIGN